MSGRSMRTRTPSQKALEVARHQQQKREVARGAESVGFAGMGERHASQIGARGGEELKSSFYSGWVSVALPFGRCCACSLDGRRVLPQKPGANATNIKVAQGGFPVLSLLQMPVRFILLCELDVEGESRNLHAYTHQNVLIFILKSPRTKPSTPIFYSSSSCEAT